MMWWVSIQHVRKWHWMFEGGRTLITDNERVDHPVSVSTDDLRAKIDAVIQSNLYVRLSLIANEVNASYGTAQKIITEDLKYRKICSHWVPHSLSPEQKQARIVACQQCLKWYWKKRNAYQSRLFAGDETWMHHFPPLSKHSSLTWRHSSSPRATKVRLW